MQDPFGPGLQSIAGANGTSNRSQARHGGSGEAEFFSAVYAGSTLLAGSALRDVVVVRVKPPVTAQSPAAIVVQNYFFG